MPDLSPLSVSDCEHGEAIAVQWLRRQLVQADVIRSGGPVLFFMNSGRPHEEEEDEGQEHVT